MALLADIIQWPFIRKYVDSVGNPRFVSDIYATQQALFDMVKAQYDNCPNSTLAIISGCNLVPGSPNKYSSGYIYFKDSAGVEGIYWVSNLLITESGYATVGSADAGDYVFSDNVSRQIYTFYTAGYDAVNPNTGMPQWAVSMDEYRVNAWKSNDALKIGSKHAQITSIGTYYLTVNQTNVDVAISINATCIINIIMSNGSYRLFSKIVLNGGGSANITLNICDSANHNLKTYTQVGAGTNTKYLQISKSGTNWIQEFETDYNSGLTLYTLTTNANPILY
jgi:hypothetical protein